MREAEALKHLFFPDAPPPPHQGPCSIPMITLCSSEKHPQLIPAQAPLIFLAVATGDRALLSIPTLSAHFLHIIHHIHRRTSSGHCVHPVRPFTSPSPSTTTLITDGGAGALHQRQMSGNRRRFIGDWPPVDRQLNRRWWTAGSGGGNGTKKF